MLHAQELPNRLSEDWRQRGFTIVELLVSIGVCTLLLALLLPAVQRARETARRMECVSRLGQLGKALHGYESAYKALPPCCVGDPSSASAHLHILPWLDQAALYQRLERHRSEHLSNRCLSFDCGATDGENEIGVFQCPSDLGTGANNFVCNVGAEVAVWGPRTALAPEILGAFRMFNGPSRLADVTDGLSNTAAMSERLTGGGDINEFNVIRDTWFSGLEVVVGDCTREQMIEACRGAMPTSGFTAFDLGTWKHSGFEFTWYNHALTPNSPIPNCSTNMAFPQSTTARGLFPARSLHPGGVNVLLLDGSVRFVSDSIDTDVWRSAGLAADGMSMSWQ